MCMFNEVISNKPYINWETTKVELQVHTKFEKKNKKKNWDKMAAIFADNTFKRIFLSENIRIPIKIEIHEVYS